MSFVAAVGSGLFVRLAFEFSNAPVGDSQLCGKLGAFVIGRVTLRNYRIDHVLGLQFACHEVTALNTAKLKTKAVVSALTA